MSEHSIAELERQLNDAKSKLSKAKIDAEFAEKRLHDAKCRESGLMGTVVRNRSGVRVLVHDVEFIGDSEPWAVKGFAFKSDGNVGFAERRVYVSDIGEPLP